MVKYKILLGALVCFLVCDVVYAQSFSQADSLRGQITPARACYNVLKYEIDVKFPYLTGERDAAGKLKYPIQGSVLFIAANTSDHQRLQLDLFAHLVIDSIVWKERHLSFTRIANAVFVDFPELQRAGEDLAFTVHYHGDLIIAKRAPWDGGFVFTTDNAKKPWIGVACEGFGASSWWPCKDHLSDEPDKGVRLNIHIPPNSGLLAVGNGRLTSQKTSADWEVFSWEVRNPINTYNVTVNIGDYTHFSDNYSDADGEERLLDYYVLSYQLARAQAHFKQVGPMLQCFEKVFGPYAFWEDGYKLVETPYWGMEHQSAVAYGNNYKNNKWGFDFIIIHESAHEWWGNSVSVADHADMWIHEGFTTYAETIYLECQSNQANASTYLLEQRKRIALKQPMVGPYEVNFTDADTDVYYKGAWMLHSMRNSLANDSLFFTYLKRCYQQFYKQVTHTDAMLDFWILQMGENYRPAWEHYLFKITLPVLAWQQRGKGKKAKWYYRYEGVEDGFYLPLTLSDGRRIVPGKLWQLYEGDFNATTEQHILTRYLLDVKKMN
ncbi:MAG: M1 family metallopeptidase [Sphingobacteriaceae bacterium]|nr:M1 family metallopeptidase [Sphingobacteriaceae bacterium]